MTTKLFLTCLALWLVPVAQAAGELYQLPPTAESRWITFENPTGAKGAGGRENAGAKGHAAERLAPGETKTLLDHGGAGIIHRVWMTLNQRTPVILRSLRLDMTWDQAEQPAVSVPLGDFFGIGLGRMAAFENCFFSNPEGRSFNCVIPMPFRTAARITITNESTETVTLFYEIDLTELPELPADALYFHSHWRHNGDTKLGEDFELLPAIHGRGRYLGANLGIIADPVYGRSWWGEGEVKIYLDGDGRWPTLVGTGTEDYLGTGWGQGVFTHRFQGCTIADEGRRQWAFYRFHVPDPVYFRSGCRVTIQQMGGDDAEAVHTCLAAGARLKPVSMVDPKTGKVMGLLEMNPPPDISDPNQAKAWTNFYRLDNYTATVYFYLDSPTSGLPPLAPLARRLLGLSPAP